MAMILRGDGIQYPDGTLQKKKSAFVKTRYTSHPQNDMGLPTWSGETDASPTIDMGVPKKSNNWYRCEYYNCRDDNSGGNGGWGMAIYRWTPGGGWLRCQAQGEHADYDNDNGDFYSTCVGLWYIPVASGQPNQQHQFKLMATKHPSCEIRINCSIGADNRIGGWQNNMFSVTEIDGDQISNVNLTTY